jgi:hypothetical protein
MTRYRTHTKVEDIEALLAGLPGVRNVDLGAYPESISVDVDAGAHLQLTRQALRLLVADDPGSPEDPCVDVTLTGSAQPRSQRRARFDSITVDYPARDRVMARVDLDWAGNRCVGTAEGLMNAASELKVCASATLRAIEKVVGEQATFNVIGVKEVPVFDHMLVVVLVQSPQLDDRLLGLAIITEDRRRAAALATLNATNRVIGRFLES